MYSYFHKQQQQQKQQGNETILLNRTSVLDYAHQGKLVSLYLYKQFTFFHKAHHLSYLMINKHL